MQIHAQAIIALLTHISTIFPSPVVGEVIYPTPNWSIKSHRCAIPSHLDRLGLDSPQPSHTTCFQNSLFCYSLRIYVKNKSLQFILYESMPKFSQLRFFKASDLSPLILHLKICSVIMLFFFYLLL